MNNTALNIFQYLRKPDLSTADFNYKCFHKVNENSYAKNRYLGLNAAIKNIIFLGHEQQSYYINYIY